MQFPAEKLAQRIKNINQYLETRAQVEPSYTPLVQQLDKIVDSLAKVKARVKIVSKFPQLAQTLKNISDEQVELTTLYTFQSACLSGDNLAYSSYCISAIFESKKVSYDLKEQKSLLIGRGKDCDLVIPKEYTSVSRHHAEIRPTASGWEIYDLNSSNGVYVEGERVKNVCRSLAKGDRLHLGQPHLPKGVELIFEESLATPTCALIRTGNLPSGELGQYVLSPNQKLSVGRDPSCNISLPIKYTSIARKHAEILSDGKAWHLRDLHSSNGTFVNGQQVMGSSFVLLHPGDKINFGTLNAPDSVEFLFNFHAGVNQTKSVKFDPVNLLKECDIFVLVYQPNEPINSEEIELLKAGIKTNISKIIIVVASEEEPHGEKEKTNITALQNWVQSNNRSKVISLIFCSLQSGETTLLKYLQLLEQMFGEITPNNLKDIMKEITAKIDKVFNHREEYLQAQIKQASSASLQGLSEAEFKQQVNNVFKEISQDKEQTVRLLKQEVTQSRSELLNPFKTNSLIYKLEKFIEKLKTSKGKDGENVYVRLYEEGMSESESIHERIIAIVKTELTQWMQDEWDKITNSYANNGLNGLVLRNKIVISKVIPHFSSSKTSFQPGEAPSFDLESFLDVSVLTGTSKVMIAESADKSDLLGLGVDAALGLFAGQWIPLVFQGIYLVRKQDGDKLKLEQKTDTLKKTISSKYQSLAKIVSEKLMLILMMALDAEKQRITEKFDTLNSEVGKLISDSKKVTDELTRKLNSLRKDKLEVVKLLKGE